MGIKPNWVAIKKVEERFLRHNLTSEVQFVHMLGQSVELHRTRELFITAERELTEASDRTDLKLFRNGSAIHSMFVMCKWPLPK